MKTFFIVLAALIMGAASAWAAQVPNTGPGSAELTLVKIIFTGNIGLMIGLCVTMMGIWMIIQGKGGGGVLMIFLGVLVTMLPGLYNGFRMIMCPIADSLVGETRVCYKAADRAGG